MTRMKRKLHDTAFQWFLSERISPARTNKRGIALFPFHPCHPCEKLFLPSHEIANSSSDDAKRFAQGLHERAVRFLQLFDRSASRSLLELSAEQLQLFLISGCSYLNAPIRKIANPTRKPETPGALAHEPTKTNPLDHATDSNVQLAHSRLPPPPLPLPPSSRHPCVPRSGTKRTGRMLSRTSASPFRVNITSSCSSNPPRGMTSFPPSPSCSTSGCGTLGDAALTRIASYGAYSRQPIVPSPCSSETLCTTAR